MLRRHPNVLFVWLINIGLLFPTLAGLSHAETIHVPVDYATIQAGIDAAVNGDTVLVASGIYTGEGNKNLDYYGKAIIVQSNDGPKNTILDCQGEGRGVFFHNGEGVDSRFSGFTIKNGRVDDSSFFGGKGGGIYCYNSSPTITNSIISNCKAEGFGGGGIALNISSAIIEDTIIEYNTTETCGGGLYIFDSVSPTISNSIIRNNKTTGYSSGGGVCVIRSHPNFSRCTISYNEADLTYNGIPGKETTNSGGISFREGSTGTLASSIIYNNKAQERGGIGSWGAAPIITNCLIENNEATVDGGGGIGLYQNSDATISKCTIRGNVAKEYGGGVSVWNEIASLTGPSFTDTIIEDNVAGDSGAGMNILDSPLNISRSIIRNNRSPKRAGLGVKAINGTTLSLLVNNLIYNNTATEFGGGAAFFTGADATITNCTITNNKSDTGSAGGYAYSGGVYIFDAQVSIANSILWGNYPLDSLITGATISSSNVKGGYIGQGNIDADPLFISLNDFRLTKGSQCIDAGNNNAAYNPPVDLGGNDRVDGFVDMGAYEFPFVDGGPGVSGKIGADIEQSDPLEPQKDSPNNTSVLLLLLKE